MLALFAWSAVILSLARALDGWAFLAAGLIGFALMEFRCAEKSHWACAARFLVPLGAAVVLAYLTPNLFTPAPDGVSAPSTTTSGVGPIPSKDAAVGAAVAIVALAILRLRGAWIPVVVVVGCGARVLAGMASMGDVATGGLIGAGYGMLAYAVIARVVGTGARGRGGAPRAGPEG